MIAPAAWRPGRARRWRRFGRLLRETSALALVLLVLLLAGAGL